MTWSCQCGWAGASHQLERGAGGRKMCPTCLSPWRLSFAGEMAELKPPPLLRRKHLMTESDIEARVRRSRDRLTPTETP